MTKDMESLTTFLANASIVLEKVMLAELEVEAEALDTVDPGIVAEYREAQEVKTILGLCARLSEVFCRL